VKASSKETILCLAGAHALVRLDGGTTVGDPMEKTTLEALGWSIGKGGLESRLPLTIHLFNFQ
jgi:manganese-transporting P-type ATPase